MSSGESSDGLVNHGKPVGAVLEVDAFPLVVHVVHDVDVAVDDGRHHVDEEEDRDCREDEPDEVSRQADVDLAIAFKAAERLPEAAVVWSGRERRLLFAEAWDLQIDACA